MENSIWPYLPKASGTEACSRLGNADCDQAVGFPYKVLVALQRDQMHMSPGDKYCPIQEGSLQPCSQKGAEVG